MQRRSMLSLSSTAAVAVAAVLCSCAKPNPPIAPPPESATVTTTSAELQNLRQDRDDAQAALAREQATHESDQAQCFADTRARRANDALEIRALDAIERASQETQSLRDKANRSVLNQRQAIEQSLSRVKEKQKQLLEDLRRLHAGLDRASWDNFHVDVDTAIRELEEDLATARGLK